jgi:hypothetical protein
VMAIARLEGRQLSARSNMAIPAQNTRGNRECPALDSRLFNRGE